MKSQLESVDTTTGGSLIVLTTTWISQATWGYIDSHLIGLGRELYLKFVYKISCKLQHLGWITCPIFRELTLALITQIRQYKREVSKK